jgi:hypothetical protein
MPGTGIRLIKKISYILSGSPEQAENQRYEQQNQKHIEQDLGNARRRSSHSTKPESAGYQRDHEKHQSVVQHGDFLSFSRERTSPCLLCS